MCTSLITPLPVFDRCVSNCSQTLIASLYAYFISPSSLCTCVLSLAFLPAPRLALSRRLTHDPLIMLLLPVKTDNKTCL